MEEKFGIMFIRVMEKCSKITIPSIMVCGMEDSIMEMDVLILNDLVISVLFAVTGFIEFQLILLLLFLLRNHQIPMIKIPILLKPLMVQEKSLFLFEVRILSMHTSLLITILHSWKRSMIILSFLVQKGCIQ